MALLLKQDGTSRPILPKNGEDFSLEELQGFVGGLIEVINLRDRLDQILVINEEGKLIGRELNSEATAIAQKNQAIHPFDVIVGDALLCLSEEVR